MSRSTSREAPRPSWPAHRDDGVWYCNEHNAYDCRSCQAVTPSTAEATQGERRVLHEFVGGNGLPVRLIATGEPHTLPDVWADYGSGWEKVNDTLHESFWINEILRLVETAPPSEESEGSETR